MNPRRWLSWAGVAALVAVALLVATRPAEPSDAGDRAVGIAEGLRCPVCQGLSVADSDSETARSIRSDIARRIDEGQADGEIRQAYVDRYGEWILLRPRGGGLGAVVWVAPVVALIVAGAGIVAVGRRRRRLWRGQATAQDRSLVAVARASQSDGGGHTPVRARAAGDPAAASDGPGLGGGAVP